MNLTITTYHLPGHQIRSHNCDTTHVWVGITFLYTSIINDVLTKYKHITQIRHFLTIKHVYDMASVLVFNVLYSSSNSRQEHLFHWSCDTQHNYKRQQSVTKITRTVCWYLFRHLRDFLTHAMTTMRYPCLFDTASSHLVVLIVQYNESILPWDIY